MNREIFRRVDWSDPLIAGRFVAACHIAGAAFDNALADVEGRVSEEQWKALKRATGTVMGSEIGDLMNVIAARHPQLDVKNVQQLSDSFKEIADAYR